MQPLRVLGVITARGGSKGVPRKNIRLLGGKPLIAWTIEAAQGSKLLTDFLVSTDDQEIADVARAHGAPVPFLRPAELATDTAKSIPVIQHALTWMKEQAGKEYDAVMILQPTSPFRTAEDIDGCIQKMIETSCDSVMSMMKLTDTSLSKLKRLEGDRILTYAEAEGKQSASRHDLPDVYKRNCAIYLTRVALLQAGDLFGVDSRAFVMPAERSLDINTPMDFAFAEWMAERQLKEGS
jgi:CMP-N-acetylneuraminic acid synthetase